MANELTEDERLVFTETGRYLAHVNTLSAGSIVVLATFADKFAGRGPSWLLAMSALGFAVAIATSLLSYAFTIAVVESAHTPDVRQLMERSGERFLATCLGAFGLALGCLAVFAALAVT
jgi:hypothetical protein